jgi:hypothetical protein
MSPWRRPHAGVELHVVRRGRRLMDAAAHGMEGVGGRRLQP